MNLRIIAGDLKGRRISLPEKSVTFRPTKDRVRQSLAETIKERVPGAFAADFCAGSGAFGIELISRGAAAMHFIERDRVLARRIADGIGSLGIAERCRVFEQDIRVFIRQCTFSYDIIFYDPPYEDGALAALVPAMFSLLSKNGIVLYEYSAKRKRLHFSEVNGIDVETRIYGDTAVAIFRTTA
jgi:16S rRNA (guanine966-N2)-methyltransferase